MRYSIIVRHTRAAQNALAGDSGAVWAPKRLRPELGTAQRLARGGGARKMLAKAGKEHEREKKWGRANVNSIQPIKKSFQRSQLSDRG